MYFSKKSAAAILAAGVMVASTAIASTPILFQQNGLLSMVLGQEDVLPPSTDPAPLPLPIPEQVAAGADITPEPVQAEAVPTAPLGDHAPMAPLDPWKVVISSDGFLPGRVSAIADNYNTIVAASRAMITARRDRQVAGTTQLGPGGVFQMANLSKGRYGFSIDGREGLALFGKYVTDQTEAGPGIVRPMNTLLCANEDRQIILELMRSTPQGDYWQGGMIIPVEEIGESVDQGVAFIREPNGQVRGQIVIPHPDFVRAGDEMDIWFIQHGRSVGISRTDVSGIFTMDGLSEGYYSMVATGKHGFLAIGVQVVSSGIDPVSLLNDGQHGESVATTIVTANVVPIPLADLQGQNLGGPDANGPAGTPFGGPAAPGGGGAGGGGAGGGGAGGVGALLAGAAGAAIGWAIADDNQVISPPGP